jgi:DNA-binding winged helix-turn-helix (wHTH) protein
MARFYTFGLFRLDAGSDTLVGPHGPVAFGQRACVLLRTLVCQPGVLITKHELMDAAWPGLAVEEGNLTVQISALRKTLADTPGGGQWIGTVARRGYGFIGEVEESDSLPVARANDFGGTAPGQEKERRRGHHARALRIRGSLCGGDQSQNSVRGRLRCRNVSYQADPRLQEIRFRRRQDESD